MTVPDEQVQAQLDAYEARACGTKRPYGEGAARGLAARIREDEDPHVVPYPCPFCHSWHIGHALGVESMLAIAALLRARSGNAPGEPGTGTTRRQRTGGHRHPVPDPGKG